LRVVETFDDPIVELLERAGERAQAYGFVRPAGIIDHLGHLADAVDDVLVDPTEIGEHPRIGQ
jgi:hypothetical protein